jgi:hypothetical protein
VDEIQYGDVKTVELCPGGALMPVTLDNREEFVRLRIDYEFQQ